MKEYPPLNSNDYPRDYYQRRMLEQMVTPGLTNPNNCSTCAWLKMGDGDGHCYMFKDAPTEVCMQHTGRVAWPFGPMKMLEASPEVRSEDMMDAFFNQALEDSILDLHDLEFSYSIPEMVADSMRKWKKSMNKRKKQARARTGRRS